jgi:hypothetical protein
MSTTFIEDPVHHDGAGPQYQAQLVPVHPFGHRRPRVDAQVGDLLQRHTAIGEERDEAMS